ncbi:hypothetical protein Ddye_018628 [Dipteronia dyeriana]|uniref:Leucine-rich repeat-containing N-terminal plant-type domain-containing protein n=1 Tax=Dipteronia dyeriana TaxID=168575 RepID=A0AAD9UBQ3_9ROSI|nr:hypothetical protein Ddye_018628 [Dipteronia dyeriana]
MSSSLYFLEFWILLADYQESINSSRSKSLFTDTRTGVGDGAGTSIKCIERDRHALLAIKQSLIDDYGHLSSWGKEEHKKGCCKWRGVSCSNQTGQHLNYLDLSYNDFGGQQIPEFIGSLNKLRYLNLSHAWLAGRVPHQLSNLSKLQTLDLSGNWNMYAIKLDWLSHLSSLTHVCLNSVNLSEAVDWMQVVSQLPSLTELQLKWCDLPSVTSSSISFVNSSKSLVLLYLFGNDLSNSTYLWLSKFSSSLVDVDLGSNFLEGPIPDYTFENMTSLMHLYLGYNQISGTPKSLGNLCTLKTLYLNVNNLRGPLSDLLNLFGCTRETLEILSLDYNMFSGSLPDFTKFLSMKELSISNNRLNGTIPKTIGKLFELEVLDLSSNLLEGMLIEAHMSNLSRLSYIDLSDNSLTLNFGSAWVPPFQLQTIRLGSCRLGPHFPEWLHTQKNCSLIDISDAGISDIVPSWFWDLSPDKYYLNVSYNHMKGTVPDLSMKFGDHPGIDLSSNDFEGPIPPVPSNLTSLNLSKNRFSGSISFLCTVLGEIFTNLDLSDNFLTGELPNCWLQLQDLVVLNLANNNFSGRIPDLSSAKCSIQSLYLRNNNFIGGLPSSLKMCQELKFINVGENGFSGKIPTWIGESLPNLVVLSLRSNRFNGSIPLQLCQLPYVQVLDFSLNNISGTIPKCLNNLTAMIQRGSSVSTITHTYLSYMSSSVSGTGTEYIDIATLVWKGTDQEYIRNLGYLKSIDISSNQLIGEIPEEITSLEGLISLNLSRNHLTGPISPQIGQLSSLDSLDLSNNQLIGEIPTSFEFLNFLGMFYLSNNNLSGKIPSIAKLQNFDASSYVGNPELCGSPLPRKCPEEKPAQAPAPAIITHHNDDGVINQGFYASVALGFIVGFWGAVGSLLLNKSWRHAYFRFLSHTKDRLYVAMVLNVAKLQRWLRN